MNRASGKAWSTSASGTMPARRRRVPDVGRRHVAARRVRPGQLGHGAGGDGPGAVGRRRAWRRESPPARRRLSPYVSGPIPLAPASRPRVKATIAFEVEPAPPRMREDQLRSAATWPLAESVRASHTRHNSHDEHEGLAATLGPQDCGGPVRVARRSVRDQVRDNLIASSGPAIGSFPAWWATTTR